MDGYDLLKCLDAIDPGSLDYQDWTRVGMALKEAGYPASVWDEWSRRDAARYHPGECLRKMGYLPRERRSRNRRDHRTACQGKGLAAGRRA